ncbi:hypothetical protein DMA11_16785 [Marinilabiliaceae bacterium JC017]|nr:hypothetical protein DMA11_16785 [Marinilabiliaceae bacterium JC017]
MGHCYNNLIAQMQPLQQEIETILKKAEMDGAIHTKTTFSKMENGITCRDVVITDLRGNYIGNTIVFGQEMKVEFRQMRGVEECAQVGIGFKIFLINDMKDTVAVQKCDGVYYYNERKGVRDCGFFYSTGLPTYSDATYIFGCEVSDTKSDKVLVFNSEIKIVPNPWIEVKNEGVSCNEVFIMTGDRGERKISTKLSGYGENYLCVAGAKGFVVQDNKANIGYRIEMINDANKEVVGKLLEVSNYILDDVTVDLFKIKLDYYDIVNRNGDACKITMWDNNSNNKLVVYLKL